MVRLLFALAVVLLCPFCASAQGILIDPHRPFPLPRPRPIPPQLPPTQYGIDELKIDAALRDQLAQVQVTQTFRNTGAQTLETQFVFPLPYDGAIDSMTLLVNGKEFPAKLLTAEEARREYESIVRRNRDPALLQWIGTGLFQTNVFPIPAGETRTVTLTYTQLLRKTDSLTDFLFPLATAKYSSQPVKELSLKLRIDNAQEIKNLYSPSHSVTIDRPGAKQAVVSYSAKQSVPSDDFRLFIDSQNGAVGMTLLSYHPPGSEEGYFLLLASPEFSSQKSEAVAKTVSFLIDKSGSMSGPKMDQTREAAKFLLNQLANDDLFNLITFDSSVQSYRPELEVMNDASRAAALAYVDSLFAGGGTNIDDALSLGLAQLQDRNRPSYVLLLTDGQPTSGERNESRIAQTAHKANQAGARLLVFGVGYDVNSRLLDRLSRDHHGLSEYVRPGEQIEAAVSRVFNRISRPVLTGIKLDFTRPDESQVATSRIYPGGDLDLFAGEQLVVVGRYKQSGEVRVTLTGHVRGEKQSHAFDGQFAAPGKDVTNSFIARLWATRRIGELIDELDLNGRNEELIQELVRLSTQHGILTPYTAFLADDNVRPELTSPRNLDRASTQLESLNESAGRSAFEQRGQKQLFKNANQAPAASSMSLGLSPDLRADTPTATAPVIVSKGSQTLYRRGKQIVTPQTAHLDPEKDRSTITEIIRFSPEYFELVSQNTRDENDLFSEQADGEELLVQLRGVNYLIK